ncbi:RidA family protein [Saccharopolyspora flava]|uniref:Enamine deaminase RidA, house cleaning of reactive enamine intermediates, YjgF/YER057c/UK114 family n=1 Tax=Saccharopolyspora flava TaxID=95161 RepID=A0A1I6SB23_9PSEU|nr:RidA family protein [Saccharopolyspora flava]SFS74146.1 Enamine deaminase RidA, house cleaning of reactive enamine intermediates, YjgF/YER057c/UK114 family [Saccharopolyspora flava]
MAITTTNAPGLPEVDLYRHVSIATGSKLVFISGQVAWDEHGAVVGEGDLAEQIAQCYRNAAKALAAAGATFDDVAKLTLHVVDWSPEKMPEVVDGITRAAESLGTAAKPPASLFGTTALDVPEHLAELEVTAVLD